MSGHIILCGLGHVGYRILGLLLRLGEQIAVITDRTRDEWKLDAEERGIPLLIGDARDERLLVQACVDGAKAIIIATDDDLANVAIALDARRLNPQIAVVVRIFDEVLAQRLEDTFDVRRALSTSALAAPAFAASALGERVISSFTVDAASFIVGRVGLDSLSPIIGRTVGRWAEESRLAVLTHARDHRITIGPSRDTTLAEGDELVVLGSMEQWKAFAADRAPDGMTRRERAWKRKALGLLRALSPATWCGLARQAWRSTPTSLRVVFVGLNLVFLLSILIFHFALSLHPVDALYFVVTTVTTVGFGDFNLMRAPAAVKVYGCFLMLCGAALIATLFSIITDFIVAARFRELVGRHYTVRPAYVVAGLGNVGYRVVQELLRVGDRVVAIERDAGTEFVEGVRARAPVILGDARMEDILVKAGLPDAKAVVAATDDDVTNLSIGLVAKRARPDVRTVLRMFDADLARKVQESLGIDVVLSASAVAAPTFAASALHPGVREAFLLNDHLLMLLHHKVGADSAWLGRSVRVIEQEEGLCLLLRKAGGSEAFVPALSDQPLEAGDELLAALSRELTK